MAKFSNAFEIPCCVFSFVYCVEIFNKKLYEYIRDILKYPKICPHWQQIHSHTKDNKFNGQNGCVSMRVLVSMCISELVCVSKDINKTSIPKTNIHSHIKFFLLFFCFFFFKDIKYFMRMGKISFVYAITLGYVSLLCRVCMCVSWYVCMYAHKRQIWKQMLLLLISNVLITTPKALFVSIQADWGAGRTDGRTDRHMMRLSLVTVCYHWVMTVRQILMASRMTSHNEEIK